MIPTGRGCREKAVIAVKKSHQIPKLDNKPTALSDAVENFADVIVDAKPLAMTAGSPQTATTKRLEAKLVFQFHCESYDCFYLYAKTRVMCYFIYYICWHMYIVCHCKNM